MMLMLTPLAAGARFRPQMLKKDMVEERPYDCVETEEASACMVCLDCASQFKDYPGLCRVPSRPRARPATPPLDRPSLQSNPPLHAESRPERKSSPSL